MPWAPPITGEYPPDWPAIADRVREEAGHRCIRCNHPYKTGSHGKGEWTRCDEKCTHGAPLGFLLDSGEVKPIENPNAPAGELFGRPAGNRLRAQWRILTVHHLDGNKANCRWWNLLALCQRCHLQVQGRVNPAQPYVLEHSDWFKPFVAGFYSAKYEGNPEITRDEAVRRMDDLLAHERLA